MARRLVVRPRAKLDLDAIYDFIAENSPISALDFVEAVERRLALLRDFPEQGHLRDDLRPGLRIVSYDRKVVIAYLIFVDAIEVVRVFYGGQNYEDLLGR